MNELQQIGFQPENESSDQRPGTTFGDILAAIRRRKVLMIAIFVGTVLLSVIITLLMHKTWRAEVQLNVIERAGEAKATDDPGYIAPMPQTPQTPVAMLESQSMWERTVQWYQNQAAQSGQQIPASISDPGQFDKVVTVTNPKDSDLIYLDVDGHSRAEAINVANAVALAFVEWKRELAQTDIRDTLAQLDSELVVAKQQMDTAINAEYAYRNAHNIVNIATQEAAFLALYQQDQANVTLAQQDLASQQASLDTLRNQVQSANSAILGSTIVRDPLYVQSLQTQLSTLITQRAEEAAKVTASYPGILSSLDAQITDLKSKLSQAVKASINNGMPTLTDQDTLLNNLKSAQVQVALTQARLQAAITVRDQALNKLNSMPQFDTSMTRLDEDVQTATQRYNTLQTALNATRLELNTTSGNVQITESAVASSSPYKPEWSLNLSLGVVLGLVFVLIAAVVLEETNRRVYDIPQIERYRVGSVLGVLSPLNRDALSAAAEGRSVAALSEPFSIIRSNFLAILNMHERVSGDLVLVTSAANAEGKTLVLAVLAQSLAEAGKSVIVIDANLRNPSLTKYFPADEEIGLSSILIDQIPYEDAVSPVSQNLAVLHSGPIPEEPTKLVSTQPFFDLLHSLRTQADIILVDSPACEYADALLIAPYVDFVIQVVAANKTSEKDIRSTLAALSSVKQVGLIVNYADAAQVKPYQLVNAAEKLAFATRANGLSITNGQIRLTGPAADNGDSAAHIRVQGPIIPVAAAPGDKI